MTKAIQIVIDLLTAAAAFTGAGAGLWNAYQFKGLTARVDTLETAPTHMSTRWLCTDDRPEVSGS